MKFRILSVLLLLVLSVAFISGTQAQMGGCSISHVVQRGETLYRIARNYGTSVQELQNRNGIANPNRILAGQTICISGGFVPSPSPTRPPYDNWDNLGIVTAARLNIRSGPGTQFNVMRHAVRGEGLRLVGRTADSTWYQVLEDPGTGRFAWASAQYVSFATPNSIPVVQGSDVYYTAYADLIFDATVYAGPNILTAVPPYEILRGASVLIIGRNADATWFEVRTSHGTGWLRLDAFPNALARYEFAITG